MVSKNFCRQIFLITSILVIVFALQISAGVMVAPTSVIMSENKRTGRITIQNPSDKPKEVTIKFAFGLPQSDSLGNIRINLQDSAITDPKSCVGWIKTFPKKMILQPRSRQVVRLVAKPPQDLADGEYWCRIIVKAQEGTTTIPTAGADDKITTKLNMIMQTVLVCKFRTGNLISKLDVTDTEISRSDSAVTVAIEMENKGNVSYVGILEVNLKDAYGKDVASDQIDLAVYTNLTRRVLLPYDKVKHREPFSVEVNISNEGRSDLNPEDMIMGNKIDYSSKVD